jgi:hypothetical protein
VEGYVAASTELYTTGHDVSRPDRDIPDYWNLYNTNPLVSQPIDTLANEVVESGWYFEGDSQETVDELTEFAEEVAIINNEVRKNLTGLLHSNVITHQVTGTVFVEKVTNRDDDRPSALQPLQTSTVEVYTRPNTSILVAPDDEFDGIHYTDDDEAAAYVQFETGISKYSEREERRFTRDEVIQWNRGSQPGAQFGVGRIQRVFERALALESKLRDNDDAIAMKAWPGLIFQFGSEDQPWSEDEMERFLSDFEGPEFGPGMVTGVTGEVEPIEFAGETADIENAVESDVNYITSGLPGPKHTLGSFSDGVKDSLAAVQQRKYRKLIRYLRNELENKYTPYFREVAEAYNLDAPDSVRLHIGKPQGDVDPDQVSGNVIRYTSDVADDADDGDDGDGSASNDGDGSDTVVGENPNMAPNGQTVPDMSALASFDPVPGDSTDVTHDHARADGVAELSDPRLTGTREIESTVADGIERIAVALRDQSLGIITDRREDLESVSVRDYSTAVENQTRSVVRQELGASDLDAEFRDVFRRVQETVAQDNHAPQLSVAYGSRYAEIVDTAVSELQEDLQRVGQDIESVASVQLARARQSDADVDVDTWMRIQQLINRLKLEAYRRADGVVGVRPINPCTPATTTLCERLAGCGAREPAEAYFDSSNSIGSQLQEYVSDDLLYVGFESLSFPPYHHGCRTEFVPLTDSDQ